VDAGLGGPGHGAEAGTWGERARELVEARGAEP
jgi:hypothetical protein